MNVQSSGARSMHHLSSPETETHLAEHRPSAGKAGAAELLLAAFLRSASAPQLTSLGALELALDVERGRVLDLPNPMKSVN